jgi:hypothetical protein
MGVFECRKPAKEQRKSTKQIRHSPKWYLWRVQNITKHTDKSGNQGLENVL